MSAIAEERVERLQRCKQNQEDRERAQDRNPMTRVRRVPFPSVTLHDIPENCITERLHGVQVQLTLRLHQSDRLLEILECVGGKPARLV